MTKTLVTAAAILTVLLACAPQASAGGISVRFGHPYVPAGPPVIVAPVPVYPYYAYPPAYYVQPFGTFNTWYDADYRAIRYNRYFSRYQDEPQIRGFTLR
jgi:hypothetical protein